MADPVDPLRRRPVVPPDLRGVAHAEAAAERRRRRRVEKQEEESHAEPRAGETPAAAPEPPDGEPDADEEGAPHRVDVRA